MPGLLPKQVRFAYKNVFHAPPTPALSFSSSTMTSSSGPVTPPYASKPLNRTSRHPAAHPPPKKVSSAQPVRCHPLLKPAVMAWDMLDHSSTAKYNHHSISRSLSEPATYPPMPYMKVACVYLPWSIRVYASNGSFVTVADVVDTIYTSLRKNITPSEFNSLPSSDDRRRATRAYEQRYRRLRSSQEYDKEKKGGMKRIDFLMGHSRFLGLSNYSNRPDEWRLEVA